MRDDTLTIERAQPNDDRARDSVPTHMSAYGKRAAKQVPFLRGCMAVSLILCISGFYLLFSFVQWVSGVSEQSSALDVYLVASAKIAVFLAPTLATIFGALWLYNHARAASVVRLANNHPILIRDMYDDYQHERSRSFAVGTMQDFYRTEQEWAKHSDYQSLQHLSKEGGNNAPIRRIERPRVSRAVRPPPSAAQALLDFMAQPEAQPLICETPVERDETTDDSPTEAVAPSELKGETLLQALAYMREIGMTREQIRADGFTFTDSDYTKAKKFMLAK